MTTKNGYSQEVINIAKQYHKWVEWSDEDQTYIGRCHNLFSGGCSGSNEVEVYKELLIEVHDWIVIFLRDGGLPEPIDYHLEDITDEIQNAT